MEKVYAITVREILEKTVCVKAESLEEAKDKVETAYCHSDIVLYPDNIVEGEFVPSRYAGEDGVIDDNELDYYKEYYQWIDE